MKNLTKNKKALITAAIILAIALITSAVASPADSGEPDLVIFLLVASSIIFIGEDGCLTTKRSEGS